MTIIKGTGKRRLKIQMKYKNKIKNKKLLSKIKSKKIFKNGERCCFFYCTG